MAENRLASQEGLCRMEFISVLHIIPRFYVRMSFQTKIMKRNSLPSSAESKDEWICTSVCPIRLHICYHVLSGCSLLSNRHRFHITLFLPMFNPLYFPTYYVRDRISRCYSLICLYIYLKLRMN